MLRLQYTWPLCGKYSGVIEKQKQQQQNKGDGGFPGDSPLDRVLSAYVEWTYQNRRCFGILKSLKITVWWFTETPFPGSSCSFCTKINISGKAAVASVVALRWPPLIQQSNLHLKKWRVENKNHSLVPQIKHTSFQRFKLFELKSSARCKWQWGEHRKL